MNGQTGASGMRVRRTTNGPALRLSLALSLTAVIGVVAGGCAKPSGANIELRRQNADLRAEVERLKRLRDGDRATIESLQSDRPTVATLPADRLESLFTVHGLTLGRLTGGRDTDPDQPGDDALRVVVTPTDQDGQNLKAAGSIVVEAFDLTRPSDNRVGRWEIDAPAARQAWHGGGMMYAYVLELPWQQPPRHADVTVKVTFTDALTGRAVSTQKVVQVKPPPPPSSPAQEQPSSTQPS